MAAKKESPLVFLFLVVGVIAAIPLTVLLVGRQTNLQQHASNIPDLNTSYQIEATNNSDGTMGPPSWFYNFAQNLPAWQKGKISFAITDPIPQGIGNARGQNGNLPTQAQGRGRGNNESSSSGQQNGPQSVTSLILNISKVEVHMAYFGNPRNDNNASNSAQNPPIKSDHWETLNISNPTTVDLVALAATKSVSQLGITDLAAGQYTEIRLYVTSATATLADGTKVDLTIPGRNNIVRVVNPFNILTSQTTNITMDFDAEDSVIKANDTYILKPVVARLLINP